MIKFPKLLATLLFSFLFLSSSFGQSYQQRINEYISQYKELAMAEMVRSGIPAAITLAQGILETAGGQSDLASIANNHFGIKCKSTWTGDYMLHDDETKNECFRKYASAEESYRDHSDFLRSKPCYAFLFKLDPTDYEGWAKGLRRAGYATSTTYSQQLIKIIVENNLQEYSLIAMQRATMPDELFIAAGAGNIIDHNNQNVAVNNGREPATRETGIIIATASAKEIQRNNKYPVNTVFDINDTKVIFAQTGTSLFAVANNYKVSFKKLLEFNELDQTDILASDQLIYLEKKSKKGSKDIHVVEANENLRDISQIEGVQLSAIMEYNGLQKGMQPAAGEKVYLKYTSPVVPRLADASVRTSSANM